MSEFQQLKKLVDDELIPDFIRALNSRKREGYARTLGILLEGQREEVVTVEILLRLHPFISQQGSLEVKIQSEIDKKSYNSRDWYNINLDWYLQKPK